MRPRGDEDERQVEERWRGVGQRHEDVHAEKRVDVFNVGKHERPCLPGEEQLLPR